MATLRTSHKPICKALGILVVPSQHILPLMTFFGEQFEICHF